MTAEISELGKTSQATLAGQHTDGGFVPDQSRAERKKSFDVADFGIVGDLFKVSPQLTEAIKAIPLGTAYAVWTGIGAVGTLLVGQIFFRDRLRPAQLALVGVMIAAMVGLKVTT